MRVITVARKPLSEPSVAANVLRHGTGALDVDACRIGFTSEADEAETKTKNQHTAFGSGPRNNQDVFGEIKTDRTDYNAPGRWPANLILQHLPGCRRRGTQRVHTNVSHYSYTRSGDFIGSIQSQPEKRHWSNRETVVAWECEPGCPVRGLEEQTGDLHVRGNRTPTRSGGGHGDTVNPGPAIEAQHHLRPELDIAGGASRFFKQVGGGSEECE